MKNKACHSHKNRGVALIIVLMFLLAISTASIWAIRKSISGENMARNLFDNQMARIAAEAALRDAERDISNTSLSLLTNASCNRGRDRLPNASFFFANCVGGFCLPSADIYNTAVYSTASTTTVPWWPSAKDPDDTTKSMWNNDPSTKPARTPSVTTTNCTTFKGGVPIGTFTGTPAIEGVAIQPEYMVEFFNAKDGNAGGTNSDIYLYRITARGFGFNANTQVVLQSIYSRARN